MANQCTKFEVSSLSRSMDILEGQKNLNGSCDDAPLRDSLSSIGWKLLWSTCIPNLKCLCSSTMKIWKTMQNAETRVVWGFRGYPRSPVMSPQLSIWLYK